MLWDTSLATSTSMILIVCEDKIRLARHLLDTSLVTRLWDRRTCWTRSQQNITRLMIQHNLRTNNWLQPGKHLLGEITRKNISPAGFLPFFREKKCCTSCYSSKNVPPLLIQWKTGMTYYFVRIVMFFQNGYALIFLLLECRHSHIILWDVSEALGCF